MSVPFPNILSIRSYDKIKSYAFLPSFPNYTWKISKVLEFQKWFSGPGQVQEFSKVWPKVVGNGHGSLKIDQLGNLIINLKVYCAIHVGKTMNVAKISQSGPRK